MKKIIINILIIMMFIGSIGVPSVFASDIDNHQMKHEMEFLINMGALRPDVNGNYNPNKKVTRGEFAVYIARLLELPPSTKYQFTDLKASNPLTLEIQNAAGSGILSGYPDKTFKPDLAITRQQMAGMLNKALRYLELPTTSTKLTFKDSYRISENFIDAVSNSVNLNIIRGDSTIEKGQVYFLPKNNATVAQASAFLFRLMAVVEALKPDEPTDPEIPIEQNVYQLATIVNGQINKGKIYPDYQKAFENWSGGSQVILKNDDIVKMSSGLAVTRKAGASSLTYFYKEDKKTAETYVTVDTELQYLDSDGEFIKVQFADRIAYVKQASVKLIPYSMLKNRSSYEARNGELTHKIWNHALGYQTSYNAGKAPSFLIEGKTYYSWNGTKFFDQNSVVAGEAYSFYQYQPVRSETNYTAEEIDTYINSELTRLENLYKANPSTYKNYSDASTKSKLIGIGSILKKIEKENQVNALMILSLALHESAYGLSAHAQNYDNLFGLYVYDDNPLNKDFDSIEENIYELVNAFWNTNYIPPNAKYANGAVFGNKNIGFNVKYASDPYWGAKAAGHYYRIDKALGFKDLNNAPKIGITTIDGLNVRIDPSLLNNPLFRYQKKNMPIFIHETFNGSNIDWVQTNSDLLFNSKVYISDDYIKELNIIK
ncbi:S-layer homology domain-containing protein [Paenisporosarcina quisquiliarum]|uniref:S-layer homology domain-containing protein n=1 Tax=Paenisporosarcina quisquiliarum TaxID=365346 RepID=UPI0037362C02